MNNSLKITLAQINSTVGDLNGNCCRILDIWEKHDKQSDLVVFPELYLCGYPPEDLVLNQSFLKEIEQTIQHICKETEHFQSAALIPAPWCENDAIYNAAILIEHGKVVQIIKKCKLPNNYVFDEKRIFNANTTPTITNFRNHKLGIMICEDIWHRDTAHHMQEQGAQSLIVINASPFHIQQHEERTKALHNRIDETSLPVIYLNLIGGQDELVFDGGSQVINSDKETLYQSPFFTEDVFTLSLENGEINCAQPHIPDLPSEHQRLYQAATLGLKDYVQKNGFDNVLIGLSGGIDSALTAAIAVDALGKDHVRCIMLPSEFTSQDSLDDAQECAKNLGAPYDVIKITDAVNTFEKLIPDLSGLAHENTQSRIRGAILMALSNAHGEMLITTGNKSEMAVGYCTLYGDMNGAYNPLKDLYKTQVYALSKWRNIQNQVIPTRILTKAPSAELRPDQKDEDSLPPYDLLDDILFLLIECDNIDWDQAPDDLQKIKMRCQKHPDDIKRIAQLLKITEYKRFQAPPGTRVSFRAFGRDRRYPMTNGYINKIEKK